MNHPYEKTEMEEVFRKITPEIPSPGLVVSIMEKIEQLEQQKSSAIIKVEPLIPKIGWLLIFAAFTGVTLAVFLLVPGGRQWQGIQYIEFVDLSIIFSVFMSRLFVVGILIIASVFLFQIWMISQKYGKSLVLQK